MTDSKSLVTRFAARFGVDGGKFFDTLKATAFKQRDGSAPTNEQMMALLVVADQYNLNPFTREIYAFPDKQNGIIPVVGADGWSRIINEHAQYDGVEFVYADKMVRMEGARVECPEWVACVIYRKDRSRPICIKEFLDEVYRAPFQGSGRNGSYTVEGPWQTHTKRMLRHKALIQCSRIAFGFGGIYDQDEAERIREMEGAAAINPAVAYLPSPATASGQRGGQSQALAIDHKKVDPLLRSLVERATKQNAWSAALAYAQERFNGAELDYAAQYLRDAELDHHMKVSATSQVSEQPKAKAKGKGGDAQARAEEALDASDPGDGAMEPPLSTGEDRPPMNGEGDQGTFY